MTGPEDTTPYTGGLRRHDPDVFSLMSGMLLVLVGGLVLLAEVASVSVDGRWVAPVLLLVVGGAGLAATLRWR